MRLKTKREEGKCHVSRCRQDAVAVADGKTFFSKRSKEIQLCEDHLGHAEDLATEMGNELVWQEYEVPSATDGAPASSAPVPETGELVKTEQVKKELKAEHSEVEGLWQEISSLEIQTQEDREFAEEVLKECRNKAAQLDEKRKQITKPLNDALRATNGLFKPVIAFYEKCERAIKDKIKEMKVQQDAVAKQALAEASESVGDDEAVTQALQRHDQAVQFPVSDGIQYRSTWKFEVVDEKQIPREYLMPNVKLIQGIVNNKKGSTDIPGIRVFEDTVVAVRS